MKKYGIQAALLAAMVFFTTAYVMHIPIGIGSGYIHLGDVVVYLAAALLPTPYAIAAAAIGAGLADVLTGAAVWALPTIIIKSVMVLPFTAKNPKLLCRRNWLAPLVSGCVCVGGYFLAEIAILMLSGSALAAAAGGALVSVLPNTMQAVSGMVGFVLLALAMDRLDLKNRLKFQ